MSDVQFSCKNNTCISSVIEGWNLSSVTQNTFCVVFCCGQETIKDCGQIASDIEGFGQVGSAVDR